MVIASSKNAEMTFFFLPSTIKETDIFRLGIRICRFLSIAEFLGSTHLIPYGYAPVLITYSCTEKGHAWKNPYRSKNYQTHPMGLEETDEHFFEDFYELTKIKALIGQPARKKWLFREGEVWSMETYTMSCPIDKPNPESVWNFFEQRYEQPCDDDKPICDYSPKMRYSPSVSNVTFCGRSLHELFENDMKEFLEVFCKCCVCERCKKIHDYSCNMNEATSIRVGEVLQSTNMQELD
jgi:hypothetical protein